MATSTEQAIIHSDPDILSGIPVFVGTRVPAKTLIDYLEGGHNIDDFLEDFPTVSREQANAFLKQAFKLLVTQVYASAA
ncbi:DUF433 domain-containing protein [Brasilonema sp. CT11]|nr:DUF433 domain-containing protein [Brasilonema sp. CT11]